MVRSRSSFLFQWLFCALSFLSGARSSFGAAQRTIYIAPDEHTDYYWTADADTYRQVFLDGIDYYLALADQTESEPEDFQSRFALDGSLWLWEYQHHRSAAEFDRVIARLRSGHLSAPLNTLVSCYGGIPAEAVLRGMYYSGRLERQYDLRFRLAVAMENQTLPFGLASLWAGSGARYSWRGICGCSSAIPDAGDRDHEMYWYTGPDGSRVLMKWNSLLVSNRHMGGYAEARDPFAIVDFVSTDAEFLRRYPYDVVGCFGKGWDDLANFTDEFVLAAKALTDANRRVVVSNEQDFFEHFESQFAAALPTETVSYGNEWDLLCASLQSVTASVRGSVEKLRSAEAMATVVASVDPRFLDGWNQLRDEAFLGLGLYWEHDWTADGPVGRDAREQFQRDVAADIARYVDTLYAAARHRLGHLIATRTSTPFRFYVFNPLGHRRTDVAEIAWKDEGVVRVVDTSTGTEVPAEIVDLRGRRRLRLLAKDVPAVGYRVYEVHRAVGPDRAAPTGSVHGGVVETPFHRLVLRDDGALDSWKDESRGGRELVRAIDGRTCNDLRGPGQAGSLRTLAIGPVSLTVEARTDLPLRRRTTWTLYRDLPRIDIQDEILENFGGVEAYSFSFAIDEPWTHFEEVGAIALARTAAQGGHLADRAARTDWLTAQHFIDIESSLEPYGVTVANRDCSFFRLGRSDTDHLDTQTARIDLLAGGQIDGPGLGILDQGGDDRFRYRFSLASHDAYDPVFAMRFALEAQNPFITGPVVGREPSLPSERYGFLRSDDAAIQLWALKPSEEGMAGGVIVRWWNVAAEPRDTTIELRSGRLRSATLTTHLETDEFALPITQDECLRLRFREQQIQTVRLQIDR